MRNTYNEMNSSIREYLPNLTKSVSEKKEKITQSFGEMLGSTISKVEQMKTNFIYTIKHADISIIPLIHRKEIQIRDDGSQAQLLGRSFTYDDIYMFLYIFRNIIWISYRKGIKQIQSDNGWGCMIRTVQMLFAQVLKRNLKLVNDSQEDKIKIIRYFSEQSDGIFSLSAICQEGSIEKRWTSSTQILGVFLSIIKKHPEYFNFEVQINPIGIVYDKLESQLKQKYPVLINLSSRVSISDIPHAYRAHYFSLMNHRTWVGTIGGVKGQALYIVGNYDDKVIFLDPHYVQSSEKQLDVDTFCCQTPRGIQISHLSPSIGFNYYIQDRKTHMQWIKWISNLSEAYHPNLIFQYISKKSKQKLIQRKKSEQFELLE